MIRRLLIRPGAIGDFIVSLPAMESLRADYTEVWCAEPNVPLVRFAERALSIGAAGLDRLGLLPADDVIARLREFDSIVSWYGSAREEFERLDLPAVVLPALPTPGQHAVEFYNAQAKALGGTPARFPRIDCPASPREFAAIHPFSSGTRKQAPMAWFERAARELREQMPVVWFCGPEDKLPNSERISDLYALACRLRGAKILVGNDSGLAHLAAAVGTPILSYFSTGEPKIWSPRGPVAWSVGPRQ